ncbi:glycosyltransferase family 9 protein [soil metagenome]
MFRRNLLIFHSGALGDFVVTWPIALAASRLYAQSRVIYVTASDKGTLAERLLRVDSSDAEGGWSELYSESPNLSEKTWKMLDSTHFALTFVATPGDRWSQNFQKIAPEAHLVHLQTKDPETTPARHVTDYLLEQLKPAPALYSATTQMLKWVRGNGIGSHIARKGAPVLIHPGSGARRKCWPVDRFVELAERLRSSGRSVRLVLGEVEREQWPAEQIDRLREVAELAQPKTYAELSDLIAPSRAFVGNDTGPTHLAAICAVPTVAIFGADPTRWQPIGPRVTLLHGDSIETISVDEVFAAVQ